MDKRIIAVAVSLFLCGGLFAQTVQTPDPTAGFVHARMGFVGAKSYKNLYYKTMKEESPKDPPVYEPLRYATMSLLGNNEYYGPPNFEIYWKPSADGDYELVKSFPVKASMEKSYLMWVTNPDEVKNGAKPKINFHELKLSTRDFPYGSATVVNFTGLPLAGKIGDTVVKGVTEAGASVKFKGDSLPIKLFVWDQKRDKIMPAYTASFATGKSTRFFIFLFPTQRDFPFYADVSVIADVEPPKQSDLNKYEFSATD